MDNIELKQYYELFTDVWKLFRAHSNPDESDQFWENYVEDVRRLEKKHHESVLFQELVLAVTRELQKRGNKGRREK